ncbi:bifunctional diguanylate cyclase/phosphodiesterase [Gordonia sp. OPL2]|uniref:putative bifunctional diguanylate cyclase/phosphodiesterase n=1 Tax=Gordonia sp. OPL2 TaxID=2486274 RepID=UPI001654D7DB|nr:EAL domain-containing protein [Gordonia sp. OPL2]
MTDGDRVDDDAPMPAVTPIGAPGDVSEIERQRRLVERMRAIFDSLERAVIVVGRDGAVELVNPSAIALLDLADDAVAGLRLTDLALDFSSPEESPIEVCLRTGVATDDHMATIVAPAGRRWISCSCRAIGDGDDRAVVVSMDDITDRHRETSRLEWEANQYEWEAYHDQLTGLLSRAGIIRAIETYSDRLEAPEDCVVVHYLDLDDFKLVNDALGHMIGDEILTEIGNRLREAMGEDSAIGRLGGDEYVIVQLVHKDHATRVDDLVSHIHETVGVPIELATHSERISVSVGVAVARFGDVRPTPTDLLRDADIALYQAKTISRGRPYVRFRPQHRLDLQRRQRIERELRETIDSDPAQVYFDYQPIVDVKRGHQPVALEALMRWRHPELGLISPSEFLAVADRSDLIELLGAHVLDQAVREFIRHDGTAELTLCLNFSRRELADRHFMARLEMTLAETGLAPGRLCIEITERVLAAGDHDGVVATLAAVRALGCQVAIDDFGTGASTLSEFYRLPISIIKTDKSFVDALDDGDRAEIMLSGIVATAHATGVQVVAEGVETSRQAAAIERVGCDFAQGYFYAFPQRLANIH